MFDDGDTDSPHPLLACGHTWDGQEPWEEMAVILNDWLEDPEGMQPVVATGHYCRACRGLLAGERLGSMEEAWAWLEEERAQARP
jgi:hypothetical protein